MSNLLEQASLVMIPSGYKEDVVYSEIPLDGSGDLSFTRASDGTRINSQGLVEVVPWNLVQQSETFNVSPWVNENNIVTSNSIVAPNGTLTADTISNSNTTALFRTYEGPITGYAQPQTLTFSTYFKYKDHRYISFGLTDDSDYRSQVVIDLQNMVITENYKTNSGDVLTSSIESVGNGWYRIVGTLTYNTALAGGNLYLLYKFQNSGTFYGLSTAQTGTGFYMWGAQLNIGSTAKPYFPTTDRLNVPRLTYQNGGGGCPSLLLEKQSTNLVVQSNDMTTWTNGGGTMTKNATTSPDGTNNALSFDNTSDCSTFVAASNGVYSWSLYVKQGTSATAAIDMSDGSTGDAYASFTFSSKTFYTTSSGSWSNLSTSYIECGNGWFRITLTATKNGGSSIGHKIIASGSGYTYVYGAQLEASSYPTSYIPTTSSSATRVQDACYQTGITSLIGQSEGTILLDCVILTTESQDLLSIRPGGTSALAIGTASNLILGYVLEGATVISMSFPNYAINTRYKIALAYKNGDCALYVNGAQADTDSTAFTFSTALSSLYLGQSQYFGKQSFQENQTVLFKTRLSNSELQSLTTI